MYTPRSIYYGNIDTTLYASFDEDDWRRKFFFLNAGDNLVRFVGSYNHSRTPFTGLASDEVYLTNAECAIRTGNIVKGINLINHLLERRFKREKFIPIEITNPQMALELVLAERRKELIYRELRWMDIKRLNKEGYNINLKREVGNNFYALPANDLRFALAIPEDVIERSGMLQNPR